jgi:hypothetical protein
MKYQLLLLLLISLSGCSSSLLKDEKTIPENKYFISGEAELNKPKIELTKKLEENFTNILNNKEKFNEASMEVIEKREQRWIDYRPFCCSNLVPSDYFYKNEDEVLEVLKQRCGIGVSPNVLDPEKIMKVKKDLLKGWKRSVSNLINVEVGKCSAIRHRVVLRPLKKKQKKLDELLNELENEE